jgi:hypothetical protein
VQQFFDFVAALREHGLGYTSGRFYGKHGGRTKECNDPQGQGRVRVTCQAVTGRAETLSLWAYPASPFAGKDKGFFFPPDEDDMVHVEFDHGDPTQPRVVGSWWGNNSADKTPATSHVPREFAYVDGLPKRRGIKTKRGHGILFDDDVSNPLVKLWTGEQKEEGKAAEVNHSLTMIDKAGEEEIVIASKSGHQTSWIDVTGKEAVEIKSAKEHLIRLDDVEEEIMIATKDQNLIQISQKLGKVLISTKAGQVVELTDSPAGIRVQDITGNIIQTGPAGVDVTTPLNVNVTAAASVAVTAGAAASVVSGGALSLTGGGGVAVTSLGPASMLALGAASSTFLGIKNEVFLGGLIQTIIGIWGVTSILVEIVTASAQIGSLGTKFRLIDERFLAFYLSHTHSTSVAGAPTGVPSVTPPTNAIVTNSLRAN